MGFQKYPFRGLRGHMLGPFFRLWSTLGYLGVYVSSHVGIWETFQHLHQHMQAFWALMIRRYHDLRSASSVSLLVRLFLACVVPVASYACEAWGFWGRLTRLWQIPLLLLICPCFGSLLVLG